MLKDIREEEEGEVREVQNSDKKNNNNREAIVRCPLWLIFISPRIGLTFMQKAPSLPIQFREGGGGLRGRGGGRRRRRRG